MRHVYTSTGSWDAQMLRDLLVSSGIDAILEERAGFHSLGGAKVFVLNEDDEPRAAEIVRGFQVNLSEQPPDTGVVWTWRCAKCREEVEPQFEVCWNCGAEKPQR